VGHEILAHGLDAEHAQHAGTAQQTQEPQDHRNGADHPEADGEQAHQRKDIHTRTSGWHSEMTGLTCEIWTGHNV
jgi:hypothetical protein